MLWLGMFWRGMFWRKMFWYRMFWCGIFWHACSYWFYDVIPCHNQSLHITHLCHLHSASPSIISPSNDSLYRATIMSNLYELMTAMVTPVPDPSPTAAKAVTTMHHPRGPSPSIPTFHHDQPNHNSTSSNNLPRIQEFPTNLSLVKDRHKELCHEVLHLIQIYASQNHPDQHNLEEKSAWLFIVEELWHPGHRMAWNYLPWYPIKAYKKMKEQGFHAIKHFHRQYLLKQNRNLDPHPLTLSGMSLNTLIFRTKMHTRKWRTNRSNKMNSIDQN